MKITWFGGTALRIYAAGNIVVVDAEAVPAGVDRVELIAGADQVVSLQDIPLRSVDLGDWRRQPAGRAIDDVPVPAQLLSSLPGTFLLDAPGEPALLVADAPRLPALGRWIDGMVVVLFGQRGMLQAESLVVGGARPRLIVLAADDSTVDEAISRLADRLRDVGFAALEPGLALEV